MSGSVGSFGVTPLAGSNCLKKSMPSRPFSKMELERMRLPLPAPYPSVTPRPQLKAMTLAALVNEPSLGSVSPIVLFEKESANIP